jgi:protein TonB
MRINKRFSAVLCVSALLHGQILFFASMPGAARKSPPDVPAKAFSLVNVQTMPDAPAPPRKSEAKKQPKKVEIPVAAPPESQDDGVVQEAETPVPPQALPVAYPAREAHDALADYKGRIRSRIEKCKEYPYQARRQEQEGLVRVRFTLGKNGFLAAEPVLARNCRHARLNAAALEAVRKAQPYPPFPPQIQEETMSFTVDLVFSLKTG